MGAEVLRGGLKDGTWLCIASGPSFRYQDAALLRPVAGTVAVVNSTVFSVPWADLLYAPDDLWWRRIGPRLNRSAFHGQRVTLSRPAAVQFGAEFRRLEFGAGLSRDAIRVDEVSRNAGHQLLQLAWQKGARRILLLGYDMALGPAGEIHHHPDHPAGMGNCGGLEKWPALFPPLAEALAREGVEVLNCSRRTALDCFSRALPEELVEC